MKIDSLRGPVCNSGERYSWLLIVDHWCFGLVVGTNQQPTESVFDHLGIRLNNQLFLFHYIQHCITVFFKLFFYCLNGYWAHWQRLSLSHIQSVWCSAALSPKKECGALDIPTAIWIYGWSSLCQGALGVSIPKCTHNANIEVERSCRCYCDSLYDVISTKEPKPKQENDKPSTDFQLLK